MPWIDASELYKDVSPKEKEIREVKINISRKAKPRFLADENFSAKAVDLLRRKGAKVITVQELGVRAHPDGNHVSYALRKGLILLTSDRDYLSESDYPLISCPAIFVIKIEKNTTEEINQVLKCLSDVFVTPQFYDKWAKIEADKNGWSSYFRYQDGSTSRDRKRYLGGKLQIWQD